VASGAAVDLDRLTDPACPLAELARAAGVP
jgi:hypothetical protein